VVLGDGYLKRRARWLLHPGGALEVSRGLPRLDSASPPSRRYCQRLGLARDGGGIDTIFHIGMFAAFRPPPLPFPSCFGFMTELARFFRSINCWCFWTLLMQHQLAC
jgi:hypothetical protein